MIKESLKIALAALISNPLRSFLASLGVVIGISFVILMGWILSGLDTAMNDTFKMIGTDMLYVDKWDWAGGQNWRLVRQRKPITIRQANQLSDRLSSAELAFPTARNWGEKITYDNASYTNIVINGTSYKHAYTSGGEILKGRYFSAFEDEMGENVAVIGHKVYETIFPNDNAIGKEIKIKGHRFTVVGVITKQGTIFFDFLDNQVYIPMKSFVDVFGDYGRSVSVAVKAGSEERLDEVRSETRGQMRVIRNVQPWEEDSFSINETKAFEEMVAKVRFNVWAVGIGMTLLSFLVGIIGIMNIMFVSVTERTKEIGIRKAIGAKKRSIWMQFIIESSFLCFVGAIVAFAVCSILVLATAKILPQFVEEMSFLAPVIPYQLLAIASVVSIFVGMLAGMIPAIKASNLDPVEAIRAD
ncbi:MAG: ABC transporter permease [Bacteroidota bacterium]